MATTWKAFGFVTVWELRGKKTREEEIASRPLFLRSPGEVTSGREPSAFFEAGDPNPS